MLQSARQGIAKGLQQAAARPLQPGEYELDFILGNVDDGRYANNGWLQELPDPVTQADVGQRALMSPKTATKLGIKIGTPNDNIERSAQHRFQSAHDRRTLAHPARRSDDRVPDGQGHHAGRPQHGAARADRARPARPDAYPRARLGPHRAAPDQGRSSDVVTPPLRVAEGAGFNAYQLRTPPRPASSPASRWRRSTKTYPLAITQEHNSMEGRGLVREAPLEKYHEDPAFVQEIGIDKDTPQGELTGYQNYESGYDHAAAQLARTTSPTGPRGAWSSTSTPASAATPASSPARRRTTSPSSASSRSSAAARCTGSASTAISPATIRRRTSEPTDSELSRGSADALPADGLPALRERAVRAGLPGQRHRPQRGRPQRHGLQPLHRHAVLREQLPLQGAPVQFLQLQRAPDPEREASGARR